MPSKSFDPAMILSDAMVKFSMLKCMLTGTSRISSWHEYGGAAKDFSVIHVPAQCSFLINVTLTAGRRGIRSRFLYCPDRRGVQDE